MDVERVVERRWGIFDSRRVYANVRASTFEVMHFQYPMTAFGRSLLPHALAFQHRSVVTIHEASELGRFTGPGKLLPMLARPRGVVFTTEFERDFQLKRVPWVRSRAVVIPLGSNMPVATAMPRDANTVAAFGVLRPGRGWEPFIAAARESAIADLSWTFHIVGQTPADQTAYAQHLRQLATRAPVEFTGALSEADVSQRLALATVGYFPFPDGASERRTSLLAALANGLPVVSTAGPYLTPGLRECLSIIDSPNAAVPAIRRLMDDSVERERLAAAGRSYASMRNWPSIAAAHAGMYARIISHR